MVKNLLNPESLVRTPLKVTFARPEEETSITPRKNWVITCSISSTLSKVTRPAKVRTKLDDMVAHWPYQENPSGLKVYYSRLAYNT
jgi:hypothetical protein